MPIDYESEKHRGFAFIEFELPEDAQVGLIHAEVMKIRFINKLY